MNHQSRFDARYWMFGAGALGRPRGMVWGGRREEGSGWATHVYLWWIHVDIWQNQYKIVKLKNNIKKFTQKINKITNNNKNKIIASVRVNETCVCLVFSNFTNVEIHMQVFQRMIKSKLQVVKAHWVP